MQVMGGTSVNSAVESGTLASKCAGFGGNQPKHLLGGNLDQKDE